MPSTPAKAQVNDRVRIKPNIKAHAGHRGIITAIRNPLIGRHFKRIRQYIVWCDCSPNYTLRLIASNFDVAHA